MPEPGWRSPGIAENLARRRVTIAACCTLREVARHRPIRRASRRRAFTLVGCRGSHDVAGRALPAARRPQPTGRRRQRAGPAVTAGGWSAVSPDSAPDRYRRRRYWPALTVIAVLLVGAAHRLVPEPAAQPGEQRACNAPGPGARRPPRRPPAAWPPDAAAGDTAARPGGHRTPAAAADTAAATTAQILTSLGAYADHESLAAVRPANPSTVAAAGLQRQLRPRPGQGRHRRTAGRRLRIDPGRRQRPAVPGRRPALRRADPVRRRPAPPPPAPCCWSRRARSSSSTRGSTTPSTWRSAAGTSTTRSVRRGPGRAARRSSDAATPPAVIEGQTAAAKPLPPIPPLPQAACAT